MNKLIMAFYLVIVTGFSVFAQTNDDYHRFEFYGGYSRTQADDGLVRISSTGNFSRVREGFNGFEVSAVRNINRYFGIKGDFSAAFNNRTFTGNVSSGGSISQYRSRSERRIYNFLGGVQVKDNNADKRFKPFAHALIGAGYTRLKTDDSTCISNCSSPATVFLGATSSDTGFGAALGGGLDIRLNKKIDIRAFQFDYNPIHPSTDTQDNFRIGFGIVFH